MSWFGDKKPNAWLTGTGSRRLEGTNSGHKNAEGMPAVGVRVEPPVRLGREVEGFSIAAACSCAPRVSPCFMPRIRQLLVPLEINFNLIFYLSDGVL